MDPVTQGIIGAVFSQTRSSKSNLAKAAVIGAIAGMSPDLDVLIKSPTDPLLALEFHRHFTHSLFFIPIGGWLVSLILHPLLGKRWNLDYRQTLLWCVIGFATHGLLDYCTTYGTKLLWPLTDTQYSIDIISVIDPLFSLPLLVLVGLAAFKKSRLYVMAALLWGSIYLSIGYVQHQRAEALGHQLIHERGHKALKLEVKPTFANIAVWKLVYETNERFYVDAIKPGILKHTIWQGESVAKLDLKRDLPWLDLASQQARDIERFRQSSAGYIAIDPNDRQRIGDIRYSMQPQKIAPLWGIRISKEADVEDHVLFGTKRDDRRGAVKRIVQMVFE